MSELKIWSGSVWRSDWSHRIYDIESIFDGYIQTLTTLLFAAWHDPLTLLLVLLCCCAPSTAWPHDPGVVSGVAYCPISIIILTIYYGKYSAASSGPGHWCHHYPAAKHWPSWRLDTDEMSDVCNPSSGCLQFCLWETRDREEEAAWSGRDDGHASQRRGQSGETLQTLQTLHTPHTLSLKVVSIVHHFSWAWTTIAAGQASAKSGYLNNNQDK